MGKRILAQRKGQGHLWARSPSHRHVGQVKYRPFKQDENQFKFKVIELIHSPGRGAPVARVRYKDEQKGLWLPPEGIFEGDEFIQANSHHGDGTRDIFRDDEDILQICLCSQDQDHGTKVDVAIPYSISDEEYLSRLEAEFTPRVAAFKPEIIFWEFGYDATSGDYGSKGLSPDCHPKIARIVSRATEDVCQGRMVAILCGGSRRDIARYCIPKIITCLAE